MLFRCRFKTAKEAKTARYVAPAEAPKNEGWDGMEELTNPSWVAPTGKADGKHVLAYAYGPMFKNYGQIGAWKYNEKPGSFFFFNLLLLKSLLYTFIFLSGNDCPE